ncbi:MAG TPA: tetratricopeptide repeat protein, partial [Kofleriaceae bacterium]
MCASAQLARADLASSRDKFLAGDYKTAIAELGKVTGKDRSAARVVLARALIATGDYPAAEQTLTPIANAKGDPNAIEAHLVLDQLRAETGRSADARRDLEQLLKDHPDDRAIRTTLGILRHDQGDMVNAKALFDATIQEFDKKKLDLNDAEQLFELAEAARYTSQFELANDSYRAAWALATQVQPGKQGPPAINAKPQLLASNLSWAQLFSQKYASELAAQTIEEVFKINPNDPDAHADMASIITDTSYDLQAVHHHLETALGVNPKNATALKVRASLEIDQNQWDVARATLDQVLAVNKEDVEAIAMKATVAWLRDDTKAYEQLRQQALAIDPA